MYCLSKSDSFISCNYINQQLMLLRLKHVSERWDMYENTHIKKKPEKQCCARVCQHEMFYIPHEFLYIYYRQKIFPLCYTSS